MIGSPQSHSYDITFIPRPLVYAYFINASDTLALNFVAEQCSVQWGGIHNLVVPIRPDGTITTFFCAMLQLFDPDVFVNATGNESDEQHGRLQQLVCELLPDRLPKFESGSFFWLDDRSAHVLGALDASTRLHPVLSCPRIDSNECTSLYDSTIFGRISYDQGPVFAKHLRLDVIDVHPDSIDFWNLQTSTSHSTCPLNLTRKRIRPWSIECGIEGDYFDLVVGASVEALCSYWALRAIRSALQHGLDTTRRTLLLPTPLFSARSMDALSEMLLTRPSADARANFDLNLWFWDDDDERVAQQLLAHPRFKEFQGDPKVTMGGSAPAQRPDSKVTVVWAQDLSPVGWLSSTGTPRPVSVQVQAASINRVRFDFNSALHGIRGNIGLEVLSTLWDRFPHVNSLAKEIHANGRFRRTGLSLPFYSGQSDVYSFDFALPSEVQAAKAYFHARSFVVEESRPGQYASAFIELLGGLGEVETIATPPHVLVLEKLSTKSTVKLAQHLLRLGTASKNASATDTSHGVEQLLRGLEPSLSIDLRGAVLTLNQIRSDAVLAPWRDQLLRIVDDLARKHLIQRGLVVECERCGTQHWFHLDILREIIVCSGCSFKQTLPVEYPRGSENSWGYRLNTLVERIVDQDLLCPVIALRYLTRKLPLVTCIIPGMELFPKHAKPASSVGEFDFVYFSGGQWSAGECKNRGRLREKDLNTAVLASRAGIGTFYYCTLGSFDDEDNKIIGRAHSLCPQMRFDVLTGKELLGWALPGQARNNSLKD